MHNALSSVKTREIAEFFRQSQGPAVTTEVQHPAAQPVQGEPVGDV